MGFTQPVTYGSNILQHSSTAASRSAFGTIGVVDASGEGRVGALALGGGKAMLADGAGS